MAGFLQHGQHDSRHSVWLEDHAMPEFAGTCFFGRHAACAVALQRIEIAPRRINLGLAARITERLGLGIKPF